MQVVSDALLAKLKSGNFVRKEYSMICEFYEGNASPPFNPSDANCLLRLAKTSGINVCGVDYKRLIAKGGIGDIERFIGKEMAAVSLTLVNISREIYDFERDVNFEGLLCVIRYISRDLTTDLDDTIVLFVGQCEKIDSFDRSSETATLTAVQILNATEIQIPRRTFTVEDALGRPQSDPEFEGFPFTPRSGSVSYEEKQRKSGFLGLFGAKKTVRVSQPWTSHQNNLRDTAVPVILGRTQVQMLVFASEDLGTQINGMAFIADGHEKGITGILNWRSITDGFTLAAVAPKNGKVGHSGSVDTADYQTNDEPTWIAAGVYSRTALMRFVAGGTTLQNDDNAPDIVCIAYGLLVLTPDGSGDFTVYDWTDNPVYLTRWLLNSEYYFNKSANWFDDEEIIEEASYCDHVLVDQVNTDTVSLPDSQNGIAGVDYNIYQSTANLNPLHYSKVSGDLDPGDITPYQKEVDYQYYTDYPINGDDPEGAGTPVLPATQLRRRYTLNILLKEQTKAFDCLFDTIFPTFNGYLVQKANGKFSIRVAKPEDFSFIYASSSIAATEIRVKNINYWIDNLGLLLIGANLANSEVRRVIDYRYDTSVSITCTASGGISSSGTLSGGSDTVAPNSTLTVSSASGAKTVTINGQAVVYTPQAGETTVTAAAFVAAAINSNNELNKYIKAIWTPGAATVLVESRIGYLELDSALENAHLLKISDPASPPSLTETSGGALAAGTYLVCYSYVTLEGETLTSAVTSITIAADKKIATPTLTLPARVIAVNWYFSNEVNGVRRYLHSTKTSGASFYINELTKKTKKMEPVENSTAEEVHRIALSITDRGALNTNLTSSNMIKGTLRFPLGSRTPSTNQIKMNFYDSAADYDIQPLVVNDEAHQEKVKKPNTKEVNGSGIDNYHQARRIANQMLAIWRDGDSFVSVGSDGEALLLEEGDVVCITDESGRYRNEPVRVEDLTISDGDGYAKCSFTGRKYRRYFYDDQIPERLVPLPIVQNNAINLEQTASVIEQNGPSQNALVYVKVLEYSVNAKFRKIRVSTTSDFSSDVQTTIIEADLLPNKILNAIEPITRSTGLGSAQTKYVEVSHSSQGVTYGEVSNILEIEFTNELEYGVPELQGPPEVYDAGANWRFVFPVPLTNNFNAQRLQYALLSDTNVQTVSGAHSNSATTIVLGNSSGLPPEGRILVGDSLGEIFSYTANDGVTTLSGITRGVDNTTAVALPNGTHLFPMEIEGELNNQREYQYGKLANDYILIYRWQNDYRENSSDGWSDWSDGTYAYGTVSGLPSGTPPTPPAVPDPPPVGFQDPLDRENDFYNIQRESGLY